MKDVDKFKRAISEVGWYKIENVYSEELISEINDELNALDEVYKPIQERAGVYDVSKNAYHHTSLVCRSMLKLLDPNPLDQYLRSYFDGNYILNTLGASIVKPETEIYTQKIHRDVRTHTNGYNILINTLVMLDDSTEQNGATWMYSGSHKMANMPDKEEFYSRSERACGRRGDVLLFDGNIWHAAGVNQSNSVRRILTPIYTKPFVKQQLDYPRAFGYDYARVISPELKQVLGYNALTPTRLEEFYQPSENRFYKNDQG